MDPGDNTETGEIRPFSDVLREFAGGAVADEAAIKLAEVVRAVRASGRKGTLTVTISVEPAKKSRADLLIAKATVTAKEPAGEATPMIVFATDSGSLVRNDPHQQALFPTPVPQPDAYIGEAR